MPTLEDAEDDDFDDFQTFESQPSEPSLSKGGSEQPSTDAKAKVIPGLLDLNFASSVSAPPQAQQVNTDRSWTGEVPNFSESGTDRKDEGEEVDVEDDDEDDWGNFGEAQETGDKEDGKEVKGGDGDDDDFGDFGEFD